MKRVNLVNSLHAFLPCIIRRWMRIELMVDRRLVVLTEDLSEVIMAMTQDYADKSVEISELLDQRLLSRGLNMPEEAIDELTRYYIDGEV